MPVSADIVGKELPTQTFEYTQRDVMLYALGVGAGLDELDFIYEKNLKVLPTFAVIPAFPVMGGLGSVITFNPALLLHGEQGIRLNGPIPTSGKLTTTGKIAAVWDKGSGAVVVIESETRDESGKTLFSNTASVFLRGEGGFGGERGPSGPKNVPPDRAPDATVSYTTLPIQAALYRLSGDRNPLHIDPDFAKLGGFDRPILHGLCTFGHVGRAILHTYAGSDPARFKSMEARFSGVVYPGETITTEMWQEPGGKIYFQAKTERGENVITGGLAEVA
ncbi:MAG TPA: MaoC/PaaZ C-terminal domain-containing protein [Dehalococcoidia bacterium]|nr:MaoC/PaaZ C-terminal domain-containing protein [Dehalococcoidia bacterium]